jgi:hypothetical protein
MHSGSRDSSLARFASASSRLGKITRFGQPVSRHDDATASFRCAACGEMAAVVKAVGSGTAVNMGPPLGLQAHAHDGIVVDYFGGTEWKQADPDMMTAVRRILSSDAPDPLGLCEVDIELAPFYCADCNRNYCHADWRTYVLADKSFYGSTIGTCPRGHHHEKGN